MIASSTDASSPDREVELERWRQRQFLCIPPRFRSYRLETSPLVATQPELVARLQYRVPDDYADDEWETHWEPLWDDFNLSWLFWGPTGRGKTGLAVGYAWEFLTAWGDFLTLEFVSVPDLLAQLRRSYEGGEQEEEVLKRYREAYLLILDDLGAEQNPSPWALDRLYGVVNHRHGHELTTVFTTNLSPAQLARRYGQRISDRIMEMCGFSKAHVVHLTGANLRAKAADRSGD